MPPKKGAPRKHSAAAAAQTTSDTAADAASASGSAAASPPAAAAAAAPPRSAAAHAVASVPTPTSPHIPPSQDSSPAEVDESDATGGADAVSAAVDDDESMMPVPLPAAGSAATADLPSSAEATPSPSPTPKEEAHASQYNPHAAKAAKSSASAASAAASQAAFSSRAPRTSDSPLPIGAVSGGAAGGRSSPSASPTRELDGELSRQARALAAEDAWRRRLGFPALADTPLCDLDKVDHVVDRATFQTMVESYFRPVEYIDLLKIGQLKVLLQSMPTAGSSSSTTTGSSTSTSSASNSSTSSSQAATSAAAAAADVKKIKTEPDSSTSSSSASRSASTAARAGTSASPSSAGSTVPASAMVSSLSASSSSTSAVAYSSSSSSSSSSSGSRSSSSYSASASSSTSAGHTHTAQHSSSSTGTPTCPCCQPNASSAAPSSSSSSSASAPPPRSSPSSSSSYSSGSSHSTYSNSSYSSNSASSSNYAAAPYSSGTYSQQQQASYSSGSYGTNYASAGSSYSNSAYAGSYAPLVGYPPYGAAGYASSYGAMPYSAGTHGTSTASLYGYTPQQAAAAAAAAAGFQAAAALSSHLTGSLLSTTSAPSSYSSGQQGSASSGRNNQSSYGSSGGGNYSAAPYSSSSGGSSHHHVPYSHSSQSSSQHHHYGSSSGGSYSSSVSSSSRSGSSSGSSAQYPLPPRVHSSQFVSVLQALRGVSSSLSHLPVTCLPPSYMTPPTYWDPSMVLPPLGVKPPDQIAINLPASPSAPTPTCTPPNPDIQAVAAGAQESVAPMPHLPQYTEFPHLSLMLGLTVHPDSVCIPHSQALLTSSTAASSSSGQANSNTIPGTASWAAAKPAPAPPTKSGSTAGASSAAAAPYSSGGLHSHSAASGFSAPYSTSSSSSYSSGSSGHSSGSNPALQLTLAAHPFLSPTKDLSVPVLFTVYSGPETTTSSSSAMDSSSAAASSASTADVTTRSLSVSTSSSAPVSVLVDYLASGLSASVAPLASSISASMSAQLATIHPKLTLMNFVTVAQQAAKDTAAGVGYSVEERQVDKYWREFKEREAAAAASSSSSSSASASSSSASSKLTKAGATTSAASSASSSSSTAAAASSSSSTAAASSTAATAASSSSAAATSSSSADSMSDVPAAASAASTAADAKSSSDDVPALETSSGGVPSAAAKSTTAPSAAAAAAAAGDAGLSTLSSSLIMQLVQFVELEARHAAAQRVKEMEVEEAEAKVLDAAAAANRARIKAEGGATAAAAEESEEFDMEIDTAAPGLTLCLPHSLVPSSALENLPALPPTPEPLEHDSVLHELLSLQYYLYLQSTANRARAMALRGQVMLQHQSLYIEKRVQWMRTIHETYACATLWQTLRLQLKKGVRDVPIPAALLRQSQVKLIGDEQSKMQAEADRLQREREETANVLGMSYSSASSTARGTKNEGGSSKQTGSNASSLPLLLDDSKSLLPAARMVVDDLAHKSEAEIEAELAAGEASAGGDEDYSVCCVCFDGESKEDNPIIYCDRCNVSVHQRCFGLRTVPDEEGWVWYCSWCQAWRDKLKALKAREKEQEKARIRAAAAQALLPAGHQLPGGSPLPPSQSPTPTNVTPTLPASGSSSNLSSSTGGPPSMSSDIHSASGLVKKGSVARGGSSAGGASGPRSSPPPPSSSSVSPMHMLPSLSPDPAMFHQIASFGAGSSGAGSGPSNPYICALCPSSGGVFKPASDMFDAAGEPVWVHIVCALWVPKARIMNTRNMEPISVAPALKIQAQHPRQCSICKLTYGACVPCSHDDCNTYFHPLCAWYEGLAMFVEVVEIDCRFLLYCLRHTPKASLEHLQLHAPGELPPQQQPLSYHDKCVIRARQQRDIRQRGRAHHSEKTREKRRKRQYLERRRKERARAMREDLYEVGRCAVCFQTNEEQAHSRQYDEIRRREQQAASKGSSSASAAAASAAAAASNALGFLVHGIAPAASVKNRLLHCEECDIEVHQCCITGDSLISMADGTSRRLDSIRPGDFVLALSEQLQSSGPKLRSHPTLVAREVSAFLRQGEKQCIELTLLDGRTLVCTDDHLISVPGGAWKQAGHLVVGQDSVTVGVLPPAMDDEGGEDKDWSLDLTASLSYALDLSSRRAHSLAFSRILGLLSASDSERQMLVFTHRMDVEAAQRDLRLLTGATVEYSRVNSAYCLRLPVSLVRACLVVSEPTSFPEFLLRPDCPLPLVRSFLSGLFGRSGVAPTVNELSSISLTLLAKNAGVATAVQAELTSMLTRCGLEGSGLAWTMHGDLTAAVSVRLEMHQRSSLLAFHKQIGFAHCSLKQLRLEVAVCVVRAQDFIAREGRGFPTAEQLLTEFGALDFFSDGQLELDCAGVPTFAVPVVGVRNDVVRSVYDLKVPVGDGSNRKDQLRFASFVANGFGVHNCYGVTDAEYDELQKRVHVETLNQNMNALAAAGGSGAGVASSGHTHGHTTSGADPSPSGWHCRRCQQSTSADKDVSCALCPRKGGAFKKTITGRWAHVVCALYTPETSFADPIRLEPIEGVSEIPKLRRRLLCSLCNRPGICVQCSEPGCQVLFHPTCGLFSGVYMGVLETPQPASTTAATGGSATGTTPAGGDSKAAPSAQTPASGASSAVVPAAPAVPSHMPYSYKCYCKKHTPLHLSRFIPLPHSYTKLLKLKLSYESCKAGLDRLRLFLKKRGTEIKEEMDYEELVWKESRMEATTGVKSKKLKAPKPPRGRKNAPPGATLGTSGGSNTNLSGMEAGSSGSGSGSGGMSSPPKSSSSSSSSAAAVARKHKNAAQLGLGLGAPNLMDPNHAQHQPYGSSGSSSSGAASSPRTSGTGGPRGRPKAASSSNAGGGGGGSGSGHSNNNTPLLMSQQQLGQALGGYSSSVDQAAQAQAQALAQGILAAASGLGGLAAFGPFSSLGSSTSGMGMGMGGGSGGMGGMQLSGSGSGGNQSNSNNNANLMMTQSQLELALLGEALRSGAGMGVGSSGGGNKTTGRGGGGGGGGRGNTGGGGGGGKMSNKNDNSGAAAAASFNHAVQQSMVSSSLENQAHLHQWLSLLDSSNASAALAAAAAAASVSTGSGGGSSYGSAANNPYAAYGGLNNFNLSAAIYQQLAAASAQIPGLTNMLAAANSSALNQQLLSQFMSPTQSAISTPPTSSAGPTGAASSGSGAFNAGGMVPMNLQSPLMTGSSGGGGGVSSGNTMISSSNMAGSSGSGGGSGSSSGLAGLVSSNPIDLYSSSSGSSSSSYNVGSSLSSGSGAQQQSTSAAPTSTTSTPSAPKRKVDDDAAAASASDAANKRAKGEGSADVSAGNATSTSSADKQPSSGATSSGARPLVGSSASPRLSPRFSSALPASAAPLSPAAAAISVDSDDERTGSAGGRGRKRGSKGSSRSRPTSPSGPASPTGPGGKTLAGSKRKTDDGEDVDAAESDADDSKRGTGAKRARSKHESDSTPSEQLSPLLLPAAPVAPAFSVDDPVLILQDDLLYDATVLEVQPCLTLLRQHSSGSAAASSADGPFTIRGYSGPQPVVGKKQQQVMPPDEQWWAFHCHFKGWNKRHDLWLTSSQLLARTPAALKQQAALEKKKKT